MQNSYLCLVTNDDCHQFVTNHAFNTLLHNNLIISQTIADVVKPFVVWLQWEINPGYTMPCQQN